MGANSLQIHKGAYADFLKVIQNMENLIETILIALACPLVLPIVVDKDKKDQRKGNTHEKTRI